jgi:type I restriction-modification system DNA methylase subunit
MAKPKNSRGSKNTGATVGYEAQLWQMADALRGSMDAAEYKHVVLGLIFLKYISDAFEEQHAKLVAEHARDQRAMDVPIFPTSQGLVARQIEPLFAREALAVEEIKTLAALRDTLLPKLVSGELRIKDAERFVGAAT